MHVIRQPDIDETDISFYVRLLWRIWNMHRRIFLPSVVVFKGSDI